ncbi:hypothetical protein, partial [Halocatena pleomorpha]|uniref:hypothetical protein n=1 Tax=Halocatena pleomorpha TaxID=1785090 RepID=UPI001C8A3F63
TRAEKRWVIDDPPAMDTPPDARAATESDGHSFDSAYAVRISDTIRHRYMSLLRSQSWVSLS